MAAALALTLDLDAELAAATEAGLAHAIARGHVLVPGTIVTAKVHRETVRLVVTSTTADEVAGIALWRPCATRERSAEQRLRDLIETGAHTLRTRSATYVLGNVRTVALDAVVAVSREREVEDQ